MPRVRYRLKKGTHAVGSIEKGTLQVFRSCDKDNNVIEVDEPSGAIPLCTREPERYELVSDLSRFAGPPGEEYNLTHSPEVYRAEAQRLLTIAELIEKKTTPSVAPTTPVVKNDSPTKDDEGTPSAKKK